MLSFDGYEIVSCGDVMVGTIRLVAGDGSSVVIPLDGLPLPDAIRWRRLELCQVDYDLLSKQIIVTISRLGNLRG